MGSYNYFVPDSRSLTILSSINSFFSSFNFVMPHDFILNVRFSNLWLCCNMTWVKDHDLFFRKYLGIYYLGRIQLSSQNNEWGWSNPLEHSPVISSVPIVALSSHYSLKNNWASWTIFVYLGYICSCLPY
jgi:hypothetical protein